jgi:hypothetical protein
MTVEQLREEVMLLSIENIKNYPCSRSIRDDFYTMWQRFGPQAARDIMIPSIWNGDNPPPSEVFSESVH